MRALGLAIVGVFGLGATLSGQISVVTEGFMERVARPGATYAGIIRVQNLTDAPQDIRVYQTDYLFFADGTNRYDPPGSIARSNGLWLTYGPSRATIPPRQFVTIPYEVAVPANESLAGSYWSMIMVESVRPGSPESPRPQEGTLGVTHVIRHGVQVVTHIGESGELRLDLRDPQLLALEAGGHALQVDVANTGERAVRSVVRVELYDMAGRRLRDAIGSRRILYPGTSTRHRIELGTVPPGRYQAMVIADAGDELFGAQYTLNF